MFVKQLPERYAVLRLPKDADDLLFLVAFAFSSAHIDDRNSLNLNGTV